MTSSSSGSGGPHDAPLYKRVLSALFYAAASVFIVFLNKIVLTSLKFPSFLTLGLGQIVATIIVLQSGKLLGIVDFRGFSREVIRLIFPLPIMYAMNLLSGLGSTKSLSLPMFVVLRRISIVMTMVGEYYLLDIRFGLGVYVSVGMMILGTFIAAIDDLSFDLFGYALITLNNVATAGNGIYIKKKLNTNELGKWGILYYNALFALPFCLAICVYTGDLSDAYSYSGWNSTLFVALFCAACVSGFILNYSIVLCTLYNSPLTTTCVGAMKNIFVTYGGMFTGGDYVFSGVNFVGINISVVGSLLYNYVVFRTKPNKDRVVDAPAVPKAPVPSNV